MGDFRDVTAPAEKVKAAAPERIAALQKLDAERRDELQIELEALARSKARLKDATAGLDDAKRRVGELRAAADAGRKVDPKTIDAERERVARLRSEVEELEDVKQAQRSRVAAARAEVETATKDLASARYSSVVLGEFENLMRICELVSEMNECFARSSNLEREAYQICGPAAFLGTHGVISGHLMNHVLGAFEASGSVSSPIRLKTPVAVRGGPVEMLEVWLRGAFAAHESQKAIDHALMRAPVPSEQSDEPETPADTSNPEAPKDGE